MGIQTQCVVWTGPTASKGYGVRTLHGQRVYVHRLTVAAVHGWDAIKGKVVAHHCDNPPCYRYGHLFITDVAGNMADMDRKGRRGQRGPKSKLTADQISAIRSDKRRQVDIAATYGLGQSHVSRIQTGWSPSN